MHRKEYSITRSRDQINLTQGHHFRRMFHWTLNSSDIVWTEITVCVSVCVCVCSSWTPRLLTWPSPGSTPDTSRLNSPHFLCAFQLPSACSHGGTYQPIAWYFKCPLPHLYPFLDSEQREMSWGKETWVGSEERSRSGWVNEHSGAGEGRAVGLWLFLTSLWPWPPLQITVPTGYHSYY